MAGGRPSKYDSVDLARVEKLAKAGWTDIQMAEFFEVDVATWNRWKGVHEEFRESLKVWKDEADQRVERSLYERACGYSLPEDKIFNDNGTPLVVPTIKNHPPDTTACIFWLKNRKPEQWRDKVDHEMTGKDGGPIKSESSVTIDAKTLKAALAELKDDI